MVERQVEILNKVGLHIRPASLLVEVTRKFKSRIWLEKDGRVADGKSVTSLLMLAAEKGSKIRIGAKGPDAQEAVEAVAKVIGNKFGEE